MCCGVLVGEVKEGELKKVLRSNKGGGGGRSRSLPNFNPLFFPLSLSLSLPPLRPFPRSSDPSSHRQHT